ncbi:MAG: pepA [Chlamydiales bacterium]|jgi:leucyl aminopeptidase|nr:pepA [Chlamydiales bacterium]
MVDFSFTAQFDKRKAADILVIPVIQYEKKVQLAFKSPSLSILPVIDLPLSDHKGKEGEILVAYPNKEKEKRWLLVGLGHQDKITVEGLRRAYACVVKFCHTKGWGNLNLLSPSLSNIDESSVMQGVSEGIFFTNYRFDHYKQQNNASSAESTPKLITHLNFIGFNRKDHDQVARSAYISQGVDLARNLINTNACEVTPQYLAQTAKDIAAQFKGNVKAHIYDKRWIEQQKMGLFLAVNQGSMQDPAFIVLEYKGNSKSKDHTVIVGKGVTYDTGGLNLKPTGSMETMKCDMSGAAAVLGTILALAHLKVKVNVTAVIAATENAIDAKSYKPGDVYTGYSGKSVEIGNTDAEGRLTLADALAYSCKELKPSRIIDLATLTGAMVIALGHEASGIMSNNDKLVQGLFEAGEQSFDRVWRLPLYEEYKEQIKSDIADLKNTGGRPGGSITAGLFLQEFIGEIPWAHIDIAGTAFLPKPRTYHTTLATGVGVRLLVSFFENL